MNEIMDENVNNIQLQYEEIKTEYGIFTTHFEMGLTAQEYYEWWLNQLNNPPEPVPSLEEVVEEQGNKISTLKDENEQLREGLKAILSGDVQTLAYILYPEDFEKIIK